MIMIIIIIITQCHQTPTAPAKPAPPATCGCNHCHRWPVDAPSTARPCACPIMLPSPSPSLPTDTLSSRLQQPWLRLCPPSCPPSCVPSTLLPHFLYRDTTSAPPAPTTNRCGLLDPRHTGRSCTTHPISSLWPPCHYTARPAQAGAPPAPPALGPQSRSRLCCLAASPPRLLQPLLRHLSSLLALVGMADACVARA